MKVQNIVVILILTTLICFIIISAVNNTSNVNIEYEFPKRRNIYKKLSISGKIQPQKIIEIKSPISGVLDKLYTKVGDIVKFGQNLASIKYVKEPLEQQAIIKELDIKRNQLGVETNNYQRMASLYNDGYISLEDFELAKSKYEITRTEYEALENEINMVNGKKISTLIQSTAQGTILNLPIKEGGSVMARGSFNSGETIASVADLSNLQFIGNILDSDVYKIEEGMKIKCNLLSTENINVEGKICQISPIATTTNGNTTFEVTAELIIPKKLQKMIKAGCSANIEIITDSCIQSLSIEEKNLEFDIDSPYVNVVTLDNKTKKYYLKTGISDGVFIEIIEGLHIEDKIKIKNYED